MGVRFLFLLGALILVGGGFQPVYALNCPSEASLKKSLQSARVEMYYVYDMRGRQGALKNYQYPMRIYDKATRCRPARPCYTMVDGAVFWSNDYHSLDTAKQLAIGELKRLKRVLEAPPSSMFPPSRVCIYTSKTPAHGNNFVYVYKFPEYEW